MSKKKKISSLIVISLFLLSAIFLVPHNKSCRVKDVLSPIHLILDNNEEISYSEYDCFDSGFTEHNKMLAKKLGISEPDAFVMGNLGKYWASSAMIGRKIYTDKIIIRFCH